MAWSLRPQTSIVSGWSISHKFALLQGTRLLSNHCRTQRLERLFTLSLERGDNKGKEKSARRCREVPKFDSAAVLQEKGSGRLEEGEEGRRRKGRAEGRKKLHSPAALGLRESESVFKVGEMVRATFFTHSFSVRYRMMST